jgi:hypothetical protein
VNATQTGNISSLQTTVGQNSTAITTIQTKQTADETAITTIQTKQTADEANIAQLQSNASKAVVSGVLGNSDEARFGYVRMWPDAYQWNYSTQTPANSGIYNNTVAGYPALNGTYVTSQSSIFTGTPSGYSYPSPFAFQQEFAQPGGANIEPWYSAKTYTASTGAYAGSVSTTVGSSTIAGEWVQMQVPTAVALGMYTIKFNPYNAPTPAGLAAPASWTVVGSTDGTTWAVIDTQTVTWSALQNETQKLVPARTPTSPTYTYFRLICTAATVGQSLVGCFWNLFTPKPYTAEIWNLQTKLNQAIYTLWNNIVYTASGGTPFTTPTFAWQGKLLLMTGSLFLTNLGSGNFYCVTIYPTNPSGTAIASKTVCTTTQYLLANATATWLTFPLLFVCDLATYGLLPGPQSFTLAITQGQTYSTTTVPVSSGTSLTLSGIEINR